MRKRLSTNIGIIAVLVLIFTLLFSSTALAWGYGTTDRLRKEGNDILVNGITGTSDGAYQYIECETQLWYWNGSGWVNLNNDVKSAINKNIIGAEAQHPDIDPDYPNMYEGKSFHYWSDPLKGTGSCISYSDDLEL